DGVLSPAHMNPPTPAPCSSRAHLQQAGLDPADPPGTMAEVHEAARAIRDAGVAPRPLSFRTSRWFYETWLTGVGDEIVNNGNGRDGLATEATFATPAGEEVMGRLVAMQDEGLLNAFAATEGGIDHYLALVTQDSSMLIETSTASTTIR